MNKASRWLREIKDNRYEMRYAKKELKKGYLSQLRDIIRLRFGPSKLGIAEYYYFRLFDDKILSAGEKEEFAGWRIEDEIDKQMNLFEWRAIANDKLLFYSLMEGLGLPYPKIKAVYLKGYRYLRGAILLTSTEAVKTYLRNKTNYPIFLKPIQATFGRGAMSALEYNGHEDSIIMGNGQCESIDAVVENINSNLGNGYVLSELLMPHPDVECVCGPRLSSVRVIVFLEQGVPQLFRAVWKIPTGKNIIDNFSLGRTGNVVASVNILNGYVERVIEGIGSSLRVRGSHPNTNKELNGLYLPCWDQLKKICLDGASALTGLRMQHWDIALTSSGPVVLEINVEGGWTIHQIATLRGMYDKDLKEKLDHALKPPE